MTSRSAIPFPRSNRVSRPASGAHKRVLVVFGTRPEAIKLCPLVAELRHCPTQLEVAVCVTAQHRTILNQVLDVFGVKPDFDLDIMQPKQSLVGLMSGLLAGLAPVVASVRPSIIVVQGDTATTFSGALTAFFAGIPVAHVEAGLRSLDLHAPFPEEMNRIMTARLASLHFAPTKLAADYLLRENIPADRIEVTGNTGIDAVLAVRKALEEGRVTGFPIPVANHKKLIVVTAHRRENFGPSLRRICNAISDIARRSDVYVVWPVHPNPNVREVVNAALLNRRNVCLIEPVDYPAFVDLMRRAYLLITDSGGVQEEGPSLGKPILVLRDKTERPEGVEAGTVKLVGCCRESIVREAMRLLDDRTEYERMAHVHNPYGDGKASARIAKRLGLFLHALAP